MCRRGFTLIELLIVVAIIAILAAIAVPNFLEAQTRAKISRVKSDQRALATAMESYAVDYNKYPPNDGSGPVGVSQFRLDRFPFITTPVSYITSLPRDPFVVDRVAPGSGLRSFQYFCYDRSYNLANETPAQYVSWGTIVQANPVTRDLKGGCVKSWGPDAGKGASFGDDGGEWAVFGLSNNLGSVIAVSTLYDATNGTISRGDLVRYVGSTESVPQVP
jgi:type II secretion system protein G